MTDMERHICKLLGITPEVFALGRRKTTEADQINALTAELGEPVLAKLRRQLGLDSIAPAPGQRRVGPGIALVTRLILEGKDWDAIIARLDQEIAKERRGETGMSAATLRLGGQGHAQAASRPQWGEVVRIARNVYRGPCIRF